METRKRSLPAPTEAEREITAQSLAQRHASELFDLGGDRGERAGRKARKVEADSGRKWKHIDVQALLASNDAYMSATVPPTAGPPPRVCCYCGLPASYRCWRCMRSVCSIRCTERHKANVCLE
eukprot:Sspe_Gene.118652::Locus_112652_Transcript_1_1_Confidence_1.000_Length_450::g.118652::m.118652/K11663/ZNHIT1, VPS71; zinc finger HIT domain-containing protein 1